MPASLWQTAKTTRGYTGHEELDEVGLVHMNGRVYDPQLGRFLSADPVVQDGTDLQAFNHYAYVRNNPLSLTDPSGFSFLGGIFNAIGKFFTGVFKAVENAVKAILKNSLIRAIIQIAACAFGGPIGCVAAAGGLTAAAGGTLDQALQAMAFSAVSIAVWAGVGDVLRAAGAVMQSGFDLARVLVHGVVQGALSVAQGGSFLNGFAVGAAGEGADVGMKAEGLYSVQGDEGVAMRTAIAGVAGGTASVLTGGKFANGAVSAAFAHLFNDEAVHCGGCAAEGLQSGRAGSPWWPSLAIGGFVSSAINGVASLFYAQSADAILSTAEWGVVGEARSILAAPEFAQLQAAYEAGDSVVVNIGGRLIQYEPGLPASGMTMFGENGFIMGQEAFVSTDEAAQTVLHELYRLTFTESSAGVLGQLATQETNAAFNFAAKALGYVK